MENGKNIIYRENIELFVNYGETMNVNSRIVRRLPLLRIWVNRVNDKKEKGGVKNETYKKFYSIAYSFWGWVVLSL